MPRKRRPAFTIIEMMFVVAILVILVALAFPVIGTMLDDGRQIAAADMLRSRAAETRALAQENGKPWRFAYLPNTGVFQIAPEDSPAWENVDQTPELKEDLIREELPLNIVAAVQPGDIAGFDQAQSPGATWITIAVYLVDGDAREDSTVYFGKMGNMPMGMELRGLTGTVNMISTAEVKASQP